MSLPGSSSTLTSVVVCSLPLTLAPEDEVVDGAVRRLLIAHELVEQGLRGDDLQVVIHIVLADGVSDDRSAVDGRFFGRVERFDDLLLVGRAAVIFKAFDGRDEGGEFLGGRFFIDRSRIRFFGLVQLAEGGR